MIKKIILMIIIVMLFIPAISANSFTTKVQNIEKSKNSNIENSLKINILPSNSLFGVELIIENNGSTNFNNVEWSFRSKAAITGTGIFIKENIQKGIINQIKPEEKITLKFRPIGFGNIYMNASIKANDITIREQKRAFIFGFFLLMFKETYMDIKPDEAYEKWQNQEFNLIIDVVGLDIYSNGHLPGAVNYVWADGSLNRKIPDLNLTWIYLVYCHSDPPSTASAQTMVDNGFKNIYRLEGNFAAWKNAGYPIET